MREITITQTNVGTTAPVPMDVYLTPFNVGLGAVVVSGTPTYTVQHSFENPLAVGYNPATATWFDHPTINADTTNQDGNYAFPVAAIRLNVTAGTGVVNLTIVQAGVTG
jgi:hypothetical protein